MQANSPSSCREEKKKQLLFKVDLFNASLELVGFRKLRNFRVNYFQSVAFARMLTATSRTTKAPSPLVKL